jgi:hypothetical protein
MKVPLKLTLFCFVMNAQLIASVNQVSERIGKSATNMSNLFIGVSLSFNEMMYQQKCDIT